MYRHFVAGRITRAISKLNVGGLETMVRSLAPRFTEDGYRRTDEGAS